MQKTAIILGATGLTGSSVLEQLLENDNYDCIKLFSRKSVGTGHSKIQEYIGDIMDLSSFEQEFKGDEVYCCIGTTKKKTPDSEVYRKIDIGIPVQAAKLAKKNGIKAYAVVSAIGASTSSSVGYNRIKGEMEEKVLNEAIDHTFVLRPSFIAGKRKEHRGGEKFGLAVFKALKFLIPKKYRSVQASAIAARMIQLCQDREPTRTLESNEI